jgi:hypothetical protein
LVKSGIRGITPKPSPPVVTCCESFLSQRMLKDSQSRSMLAVGIDSLFYHQRTYHQVVKTFVFKTTAKRLFSDP